MTKLENAALTGFKEFKTNMCSIWQLYLKYGDVVLEKDLEEGNEELKKLFTESNKNSLRFCENILEFWRKNYHFVVNNFQELVNVFLEKKGNYAGEVAVYLLPDSENYSKGETRGNDQRYAVSEDFYHKVSDEVMSSISNELMLLLPEKNIYCRVSLADDENRTFKRIKISNDIKVIYVWVLYHFQASSDPSRPIYFCKNLE